MQKFSCLIPAYNEEGRVGNVVRVAKNHHLVGEVIVISDGSQDKTAEEARFCGADKVIDLKENIGKGGAIFIGANLAKFPYLLLLDADLINLKPEHLDLLCFPLLENEADMTIGVLIDDIEQRLFPYLSGQRAIKREIIINNPQLKNSRFQIEIILNQYVKKRKYRLKFVNLSNLSHFTKGKKYSLVEAWRQRFLVFLSFLKFFSKKVYFSIFALLIFLFSLSPLFNNHVFSNINVLNEANSKDRILLIVAHPDDEIISMAGYLLRALKNNAQVMVVIATRGDGNKYYAYLEKKPNNEVNKFLQEAIEREKESYSALNLIGVDKEKVLFLDFPDRGLKKLLTSNWSTPYLSPFSLSNIPIKKNIYNFNSKYTGEDLLNILIKIMDDFKPTKIFTHSYFDTHPDHKSLANFVDLAFEKYSANNYENNVEVYSFLIHYYDFSNILFLSPEGYLLPPKKLADKNWLFFYLNNEEISLKERATLEYKSQLKSPYLNLLLKSFIRKNELFLRGFGKD